MKLSADATEVSEKDPTKVGGCYPSLETCIGVNFSHYHMFISMTTYGSRGVTFTLSVLPLSSRFWYVFLFNNCANF